MDEIEQEINDLDEELKKVPVEEPAVTQTTPTVETPPAVEVPSTPVVEEAKPVETVATTTTTTAPTGDSWESKYAEVQAKNAALLEQLNQMSERVLTNQNAPQQSQTTAPIDDKPIDFLKDQDFDDIMDKPEKFNAFMNNIVQHTRRQTIESMTGVIPKVISTYVTRELTLHRMTDKFYADNADLAEAKPLVAIVANDISSKDPQLGIEEVFKQTAERTRSILNIQRQTQGKPTTPAERPGFAAQPTSRKPAEKLSGQEAQIAEMEKHFG